MRFKEYLESLLGKKQQKKLMDALKQDKTVIVSGEQQTGKTTLVAVLQQQGYKAVEDFDTYEVHLLEPLNHRTPNMKDTIFKKEVKAMPLKKILTEIVTIREEIQEIRVLLESEYLPEFETKTDENGKRIRVQLSREAALKSLRR